MTGLLSFPAVSMTAFIELVPMQLAAGRANRWSFANSKTWLTASPVSTPAGKSLRSSVTVLSVREMPLVGQPNQG
jgi:hypothetical protein